MWMRTPDGRLRPRARARRLRHRPHADRHRTAPDRRLRARPATEPTFTSAVTSHNLWFHRPFRTDEWLLLRQHSPVTAHGRCFGRGDVLTEGGSLVASYAQEALCSAYREQPFSVHPSISRCDLEFTYRSDGTAGDPTLNTRTAVVQWATGNIGTRVLRGVIEHPTLTLAGRVCPQRRQGRP